MIKLAVRNRSIKYSKTRITEIRKEKTLLKRKSIEKEIVALEKLQDINLDHNKTAVQEQVMHKKKELETIIEYKKKGVIISNCYIPRPSLN